TYAGRRASVLESHPPQWVDRSVTTYVSGRASVLESTHGSGGIVQLQPTGAGGPVFGITPPAVGRSSSFNLRGQAGQCSGIPPTAVGGSFSYNLRERAGQCSGIPPRQWVVFGHVIL